MESNPNKQLLEEFPPHTFEAWKEAAIQLLKGRPFEKTLITRTYEGFDLQPIYTRETTPAFPHLGDQPGTGSQVRGSRLEGYLETGWLVSQELAAPTPEELNDIALPELEQGQNELNIWLDRPSRSGKDPAPGNPSVGVCGLSLATAGDIVHLLKGIHLEMISLYWHAGAAAPALYPLLVAALREAGVKPESVAGCLGVDPVGWMAETGEFPGDPEAAYDQLADLLNDARERMPRLQVLEAQGHSYHNGGASSTQEMAVVLATGVTYLREAVRRGIPAGAVVPRIRLSLSIGSNYFIEIAKLRAMRLLWSRVMDAFEVPEADRKVHLHARTGLWNKTVFDPYVNMLRTTTEAFSAVVGGCDSLHVAPFDEIIRESDAFSRRVARNTHAILGEECGMMQVLDPAGGSWAVETLTDEMARAAWKTFQEIESAGGVVKALESGSLQAAIEEVRQDRTGNIQRRKDVIIGTNTYPNATEKLLERRPVDYGKVREERIAALGKAKSARDEGALSGKLEALSAAPGAERFEAAIAAASEGATLQELTEALSGGQGPVGRAIRLHRAAEEFEALRLAAGKLRENGLVPRIHQLNMGPSRKYRIRADWTSSFFQVGGFEVLSEDDYETAEAAVAALRESTARVAVITSDDETYAGMVEPLARAIKEADAKIRVIVAGAPGDGEAAWRAAGVDDFVHVRVNNYTFNRGLLEAMGARL